MKTSILILIFFILCCNLQAQWLFKEINASSSYAALPINTQFINPNTGFVLFKIQNYINSPIDWRIMKTTNKGNNWEQVFNVNSTDDLSWADISFININTGILVYREHSVAIRTYYTTNSGINWNWNALKKMDKKLRVIV